MFNIEKKSLEDTVRHSTLQEGINFLVGFSADAIPVATASMNSNYFINIKHIKQRRLHNLKKWGSFDTDVTSLPVLNAQLAEIPVPCVGEGK